MNYYHRHLGDYAKDTTNLSMIEHGAYNLLIDRYYGTEKGLPVDQVYRAAKAVTKDERQAVDFVLKEFFQLKHGVWVSKRCDEEILKAKRRMEQARLNGRKGGRPETQRDTGLEPTGFQSPVNPVESSPISNLQSPILRKESETKNGHSESRREEILRFAAGGLKRIPQ